MRVEKLELRKKYYYKQSVLGESGSVGLPALLCYRFRNPDQASFWVSVVEGLKEQ